MIMWSILRLVKWYKKPKIKNTIILAIITGLTVMTKSNGAIVAIPIIYVFLLKLYKELKKAENKKDVIKKYFGLFVLFGIIALPIGLWYNIRNYILFNQPILYVLDPEAEELYVGEYSYLQRFLPFSKQFLEMYAHPYEDYCIPIYLLKTSLFGEWVWGQGILPKILYWPSITAATVYTLISIWFIIKELFAKTKRYIDKKFMFMSLLLVNLISFIAMNIKLPYGCSMDFRYTVPVLFVQGFFICFGLERIGRKNKEKEKKLFIFMTILTSVMLLLPDFIFMMWKV